MFDFNFKNLEKGDEGNYHNNIPIKTESEVLTVSVLEEKIRETKAAIARMEENSREKGVEMSESAKELVDSLNNKIRDYTIKLEELKNNEEKNPELVKVFVDK